MAHRYLVGLGSNVRHPRHGKPANVLRAALGEMEADGLGLESVSRIHSSAPVGPSRRRYANAAAVVSAGLEPEALLAALQSIEDRFGRRRGGQRWGARVLDLDIVLWDGGELALSDLAVPHPDFRSREFVLRPALAVAADWRDPVTGFTIRQLLARLTQPRRAPR